MKKSIFYLLFAIIIASFINFSSDNFCAFAQGENSKLDAVRLTATAAMLIDFSSGEVVYEKNSHQQLPIASMTKIASLAIVFDALDKQIIKISDSVVASKNAASTKGSSAFLDAGSTYNLGELLKSIIIASANDSCVALAEYVCGSENAFVAKMNDLAKRLNLADTHFENCTGLPAKNHYSSAFDILQIYKLICDNQIYKSYAKIWLDDFMHPSGRRTQLTNTNRLLKTYDGIEGGKTGYTDMAKFCLTASAARGNMRLLGVVIGVGDSKTRFAEMSKLFDYGFDNFKSIEIVNKNVPITIFDAKNAKTSAEVYPSASVVRFMKKSADDKFSTDYQIFDLKAPRCAGDVVGELFVFDKNNMLVEKVDLVLKEDIEEIDLSDSLKKIVNIW